MCPMAVVNVEMSAADDDFRGDRHYELLCEAVRGSRVADVWLEISLLRRRDPQYSDPTPGPIPPVASSHPRPTPAAPATGEPAP